MKAQALSYHLAENPVDDEYEPLKTYFPDEEVMCVDEVYRDENPGQNYPVTAQLRFYCTNNMAEYEACILGLRHIPRIHNEIADALATLASMLHHPDKAYVDPVCIQVRDQHAYCNVVEEEIYGEHWFRDIKEYIRLGVYQVHASGFFLRTIRRLASGFFLSGEILYKRTPDLGLLRCIDAKEASTIMDQVHSGVCGPHMKAYVLAKKILRAASNGHRFILVAIDYFTKWVEAVTLKSVIKKVVVDFVHSNIICRFGIPKMIITDNAANLNSHLMKEVCQQFKIMHRNSTTYRPKENGAVENANKNIKKILRKMVQGSRQWHENLSFALLGYRTTVRISVGATPYLLAYGIEAVIPAEVEILSLRIVVEAKIDDDEWVKTRLEQLSLIDEKRLVAVEAKGKFTPNWQRPFIVTRVFPNGALYLTDIEGKCVDMAINSDASMRYYV
ncbi:uncharacterized protein [Nicotiana sylvestris]|uniref:uncharacterized protein n=1 Tax=Nicotiana sylvestris TaxID=4096 RepID=UPI00388C9EAB